MGTWNTRDFNWNVMKPKSVSLKNFAYDNTWNVRKMITTVLPNWIIC